MAGDTTNKRTPAQIIANRAEIAERYLKGETQWKIAQSLGMTQQMVSYDLQVLYREWRQSAVRDIDEHRAQELAKVDQLELVYWQAWEESKRPKETTNTEKRQNGEEASTKAAIRKEERDGNPAYLAGVQWCIDKRCRILGLDAAVKVNVEHRIREAARAMGLDEEEAVEEARRIINTANGR